MPNEYGGAKGQTQTKTVTAACSIILTNKKKKIALKRAYIGQVIDLKQKSPMTWDGRWHQLRQNQF